VQRERKATVFERKQNKQAEKGCSFQLAINSLAMAVSRLNNFMIFS
jgi:hypothetical protein